MASCTPITLSGENLGQRHRHLNSLVLKAKETTVSIQDVEAQPEESAVDRLFKIDLATELQHVDYIIRNLKDDDMLYVSRALKATWLIEHRDIVNPKYLEDVLFPEMIKPAVTKMKHWLYINLRDPAMCEEFYQHYKENTFEFAIKFLSHCRHEFILEEAPKILTKLTTHSLKVLCEKCPGVAKIYFDSLETDEDVKTRYLKQEQSYYNSVKCVLKLDADVFLDITEKYFNMNSFSRLSPLATDYILRYHKTRFTNKLELYVAYILHISTVAARLSVEECQEVVLKLAQASYLQQWFQYKVVEPLIKRLSPEKRPAFKKRLFVTKDVGDCKNKWAYEIPAPPVLSNTGTHIFDDQDLTIIYCPIVPPPIVTVPIGCGLYNTNEYFRCNMRMNINKNRSTTEQNRTDRDRLFDEFRFIGFKRALFELEQRLNVTTCPDRRRDIFMVLVNKTGGRTDAVSALLRLASRHINEPPHIRAAILRSLVRRASVWRLPEDVWQQLLDYGHGLGLDGTRAKPACREGLHAVVIRQLLAGECEQAVCIAFMRKFSTLVEYSLNVDERMRIANGLQNMLVAAAIDSVSVVSFVRFWQLLDVLKIYRIRIEPTSSAFKVMMNLVSQDANLARPLLERLYDERIARRELLHHNIKFQRDEAALLNALRHEPKLVLDIIGNTVSSAAEQTEVDSSPDESTLFDNLSDQLSLSDSSSDLPMVPICITPYPANFDRVTSKLVIYFEDFTPYLRTILKENITQDQNFKLVRQLASLLGNNFENELREFDAAGKGSAKFAAALRACAHRARPVVNLAEWGWRKAGVKAVATRAMRCREIERAAFTRALATERRTVKVALALSMRSSRPRELLLETFTSAAKLHPVVALRTALLYFRRLGANADLEVWPIIKPLFSSVDLVPRKRLCQILANTDWIPSTIESDYCATLYVAFNKIARFNADNVLCNLSKLLPDTDGSIVKNILLEILNHTDNNSPAIPCPGIFIRYLMLSASTDDLECRFELIGNKFLQVMETLHSEEDHWFQERLDQILKSLKYNAAFFNSRCTSCSTVIERILTWLQKFMPKEKYFNYYTEVRLTLLYYKAVRQSMKEMPEVFADPKRRKSEGVQAVGFVFGRYIVKEVAELVSTHFDSIIELYTYTLMDYLRNYFGVGNSKPMFIGAVLKGIWEEGVGIQRRMVVYVLTEQRLNMDDSVRKELEELMMDEKALEIFVHAEIYA